MFINYGFDLEVYEQRYEEYLRFLDEVNEDVED